MQRASEWLDKATIRALAVRASCDPRSIQRVIEGKPVRGLAGQRAMAVLLEMGVLPSSAAAAVADEAEKGGQP